MRTPDPGSRKPLRRISKKRARSASKRRKIVRDAIVAQGGRCAGQDIVEHDCHGPLVGHEPLKRSAGGDPLDPEQVIAVCSWVNGDVEDRPWLYADTVLVRSMGERYAEGRLVRRDAS